MRQGFFNISEVRMQAPPAAILPKCGSCGLLKHCESPKMPVSGKGRKGVLIVGEAPGRHEDVKGVQFVGQSGQLLEKTLRGMGVDMRRDCWLTNALICRPTDNATPTSKQIEWCRPNVIQTIKELQPHTIILTGSASVASVIGWLWREDTSHGISRWCGWRIPSQRLNAWICPTFHPSHLLRAKDAEKPILEGMFERHLEFAFASKDRPWSETPDYLSEVEIEYNSDRAAMILRKMVRKGGVVSFDYETNMLKPDNSNARIVSCSVCWNGKKTIAYPWKGAAILATQELLQSELGKIAHNMKFEERWTRKEFGHGVRNWDFDPMLGAHLIDQRKEITSLKFLSFVLLGQDSYDDHIKGYLQANGTQAVNRIREVKLDQLLRYNGLDSLLTFKIADILKAKLKL